MGRKTQFHMNDKAKYNMKDEFYYVSTASFEAARKVEILPEGHRARNLHGHSFQARMVCHDQEGKDQLQYSKTQHKKFKEAANKLDYSYLNDTVSIPTDENLARWFRDQLKGNKLSTMGVQSAIDQGIDIDPRNVAHTWCKFRFEASHKLPNVPDGHQCGRMHGHGFEVIIHVKEDVEGKELGIDFDKIRSAWTPLFETLNNNCLNDIETLENPTSEMLSTWIWKELKLILKNLSWVTVYETSTAGCHFDGTIYRIWKEFKFESAILNKEDSFVKNITGHSYTVRLHLTAPLDIYMGWTIDYGDVKEIFKPIYNRLDHHYLSEIEGLYDSNLKSILFWIKNELIKNSTYFDRIDISETPEFGASLSWGEHEYALPI